VARVLAARPRVILADEPTGQLDSAHAAQVVGLVLDAATRLGAALVLSTHDSTIAERLPERWRMADGLMNAGDEPC
jgi:putative ABC transport system ATP-binding protein